VNIRRLAVTGLAVFASAAIGTAGCTSSNKPGSSGSPSASSGSSAASSSPTDTLLAAVKKLNQSTYQYTLTTGGLSGKGAVDPVGKKVSLSLTGKQSGMDVKWDMILISPDYWMRIDFGGQNSMLGIPAGKWLHIDQSKIKNASSFGIDPSRTDPTRISGLFDGMTDAKKVDATHYTVTLDLTKATGSSIDASTLTKMGDKAKTVPATVTLDDQGRLAALALDLSSVDTDASINSTYSDYGAPVNVTPPGSSETVEAPDAVYRILNG